MKILAVGGGSGGHVTPVVAVLAAIKDDYKKSDVDIRFWCDKKFAPQAKSIINKFDETIRVDTIFSGKFRRYNHLTIFKQIMMPSIFWSNFRDIFFVITGFIQSVGKLLIWRPDVVFTKGGYVCLPVGIAAHFLNIPLVIHDSDAHPGLTNRILSRFADEIATGAPLEFYSYPKDRTHYVGIPVSKECHRFSDKEIISAKEQFNLNIDKKLIVITGGGLGAKRINDSVVKIIKDLLRLGSVVLISGSAQYDELKDKLPKNSRDFQLLSFVSEGMISLLGASDLVIARAGATTILELAALEKPTILIPNGQLTGGHQLKNAAVYENKGAVLVLKETEMLANPHSIIDYAKKILSNDSFANKLSKEFVKFAKPNSAKDMAEIIVGAIKK
jgi:UDP-N-acetylglucosamine--N-acetylmuramyl-(pentapeptide) pyrophosphoryl-undecaprenol N-acetylglucosamine transferase